MYFWHARYFWHCCVICQVIIVVGDSGQRCWIKNQLYIYLLLCPLLYSGVVNRVLIIFSPPFVC